MPKVSIVLPNYNYEQYLDERIQSLLNQTYQDFELIILDDASKDSSIQVINKYVNDTRVITKFYTENSGLPYKRWNDGSKLATGEYLLFAGADDSCDLTMISRLVDQLDRHPSVGLAFSQSWEIDSNGNRLGSMIKITNGLGEGKERWEDDFITPGRDELRDLLFLNTIPNASCVLMRLDVFVAAGRFDEKLILAADWMLWSKMLMISDLAFIAEPLNYFRTHPNTVRQKAKKKDLDVLESILVRKHIMEYPNLAVAPPIKHQVFDMMQWEWIGMLLRSLNSASFKQNLSIYKYLSSVNPKVGWQLAVRLVLQHTRSKTIAKKFKDYVFAKS
jgi:glycosyltransferase involved in cell wall biosynthesis